ncbi:acyltransferase [Reinekea marinisedimentorum]|uniref:Succinyltransferase-like protein n=1 Tax=Reinekea marinisedimentorum TaxID=230495 RepID=A0A4V6NXZ4_9GAMM|nr:acyltransferase [Reinekea marinisedimentorum]TCS37170.1 succinyltransferase-like protein [Reinekea marinisedimentorum]
MSIFNIASFFRRAWNKVITIYWNFIVPLRLKAIGVELGKNVTFYGMPIVTKEKGARICIGDNVTLCSDSRFTALGVNHPVILRAMRSGALLSIGNNSGLSGTTVCSAEKVSIGKECLIGANVVIADTDFHPIKPEGRRYNNDPDDIQVNPVNIGDNIFIGTNSIVLKGASIGENSIIGAGSLVRSDVPANEIWAGQPAKLIGTLDDQ